MAGNVSVDWKTGRFYVKEAVVKKQKLHKDYSAQESTTLSADF